MVLTIMGWAATGVCGGTTLTIRMGGGKGSPNRAFTPPNVLQSIISSRLHFAKKKFFTLLSFLIKTKNFRDKLFSIYVTVFSKASNQSASNHFG
jgi:hypothetical protein